MKKLNNKGFTLVELLAVIVILAIVVGITFVTVLPALKDSRQKAFELTAQTAADFVEKQYQLHLVGSSTTLTTWGTKAAPQPFDKTTIAAAGLKPQNYQSGTYYVDTTTGRACVTLTSATTANMTGEAKNLNGEQKAGEYHDVETNPVTSSGCQ